MKIKIITVGTPHLSFARQGIDEYLKRLQRFADVTMIHIKENKKTTQKLLDTIGRDYCVLLDENGREYTSRELSVFLDKTKNTYASISFVIGGPDGHVDEIRNRGDVQISLSRLTLPHDLAMLFLCETLYRSHTISAGHPYHRD